MVSVNRFLPLFWMGAPSQLALPWFFFVYYHSSDKHNCKIGIFPFCNCVCVCLTNKLSPFSQYRSYCPALQWTQVVPRWPIRSGVDHINYQQLAWCRSIWNFCLLEYSQLITCQLSAFQVERGQCLGDPSVGAQDNLQTTLG